METIKTVAAVVGAVVIVAGTAWAVIKLMAKYGTHIVTGCKAANTAISSAIKKIA